MPAGPKHDIDILFEYPHLVPDKILGMGMGVLPQTRK